MTASNTPLTLSADEAREYRIEALRQAFCTAETREDAALIWEHLKAQIAARSAGQVAAMERQKGLL